MESAPFYPMLLCLSLIRLHSAKFTINIRFYNAFNEIVQTLSEKPGDTRRFEMRVIANRMSFLDEPAMYRELV